MNDDITAPDAPQTQETPPAADAAAQEQAGQAAAPAAHDGEQTTGQEQAAAGQPASWLETLPQTWREKLTGCTSEEEALKALERGQAYTPAQKPEDVALVYPENLKVDDGVSNDFKRFCVEQGITPGQAQALLDWQLGADKQLRDAARQTGEKELRAKWGARYDDNVNQALKAVVALDKRMGGRFAEALTWSGMKDNPVMVEALHAIGQSISEDALAVGSGAADPGRPESPEETYNGMFKE